MNEETRLALKKFSSLANWGTMGHPNDMDRFWDFVIVAIENDDIHINSDQFKDVVGEDCLDEEVVDRVFFKYENGIDLLRRYLDTRSVS